MARQFRSNEFSSDSFYNSSHRQLNPEAEEFVPRGNNHQFTNRRFRGRGGGGGYNNGRENYRRNENHGRSRNVGNNDLRSKC